MEYSWLTILWWFQVNSEGTQPYIYVHPFSPSPPPIQAATEHWAEFPVLYSRALLVIHSNIAVSACWSATASTCIPSPHGNHTFDVQRNITQPFKRMKRCQLQQHGWTWRLLYWVKCVRQRRRSIIWLPFCAESKKWYIWIDLQMRNRLTRTFLKIIFLCMCYC